MDMPPQDQAKPATPAAEGKNEFTYVSDDHKTTKGVVAKVGRKYATALAGFIAGVIVASLVFYPWLHFLGKLCPVGSK